MGKGFGQPTAIPTRSATQLMRAFGQCYAKAKGDPRPVDQFLKANLSKLDDQLLAALPHTFSKLLADGSLGDRHNVASLFVVFGNLVYQFPLGDRALNLELSIAAYKVALKVFSRDSLPEDWAAVQNDLGLAYCHRVRGNRAENLEQAINACYLALQVYARNTFPKEWATTQNNLGIAYYFCIRGDRAKNLEQAIAAYELALQVFTYDAFPQDWAGTQNNLGNAYRNRIRGDRPENLEQAIAAYKLALQVFTSYTFPQDWASTQNNLGNTYCNRIRGDRADNLEQAIAAYQQALQVRTRDALPEKWAGSIHNLANAYCDRIQGDPQANLNHAINLYQQAAQVFTQDALPLKWAENQGALAETLIKRAALTHQASDLDTAITLLQQALAVAVPGSPDFIDSQYRLGTALSRRFEQSQAASDLQAALQAYKTALDALSPEHYDRAKIWQALPTTQSILGNRLVRDGQWQEGLQLLLNSVRLLSQGDDPLAHANALYQTGHAHETLADWENARLYYRDALRLYQHLDDPLGMAKSRHGLGSVLASQGYFKKGMAELDRARTLYHQLNRSSRVAEVNTLYQAAQQAEQQLNEVAL